MLLYLHCHISSPQRYDTFACCFIFIVIFLLLKGTIRLHVALSSLSYFFSSKVRYVCMLLYLHCHISSPQRYDTFACCFIFIVIFLLLKGTIRLHVALSSLSYFFSSKVRYVCMLLYLHCHISSPQRYDTFACCFIFIVIFLLLKGTIRLHVALSSLSYFFSSKVRYVCMLLYLHCHISSPQRYDTFACCFIFIVIFLLLKGTIRLHVALSSLSYFFSSKVRYVCMLLYLNFTRPYI